MKDGLHSVQGNVYFVRDGQIVARGEKAMQKPRKYRLCRVDSSGLWYSGRYATGTPLVTRKQEEAMILPENEAVAIVEESKSWNRGVWSMREVEAPNDKA